MKSGKHTNSNVIVKSVDLFSMKAENDKDNRNRTENNLCCKVRTWYVHQML